MSKLEKPKTFSIRYEQYITSPDIAARIVYQAFIDGNIHGRDVADFGCGNAVLSVAAALLGAEHVYAYDIDPEMIAVAEKNVDEYRISIFQSDVMSIGRHFDTVVMNPPWGSYNIHADLPFVEKAASTADHIYAIHNRVTEKFLDKLYTGIGEIRKKFQVSIDVPRTYAHHVKESVGIDGIVYCVDVTSHI